MCVTVTHMCDVSMWLVVYGQKWVKLSIKGGYFLEQEQNSPGRSIQPDHFSHMHVFF